MKKLILFFVLFIFWISGLNAQTASSVSDSLKNSLKIISVEVFGGKGAIASGLYGYLNLENSKSFLSFTLSNEDIEITYLGKFWKEKLLAGGNVGYFKNCPYVGPYISFSPVKYINFFHWTGLGLGNPEIGKLDKFRFIFMVNQMTINVWRFSPNYCLINYLDFPIMHVASIKYTQPIISELSGYTEIGYKVKEKEFLFKIGTIYKF